METFCGHGLPSSLYTDRGSHYFVTLRAGEAIDKTRPTQVGRALQRLGIEHIPAYSPEARGRSERMFSPLQQRLPRELALAGIRDIADGNRFIADVYLPAHNVRFARPPEIADSAFVAVDADQLAEIQCVEEERIVGRDNTIVAAKPDPTPFRQGQCPGGIRSVHFVGNSTKLTIARSPRDVREFNKKRLLRLWHGSCSSSCDIKANGAV
ncbi:hypothetical protein [Mesorhizobium sp. 128a]